MPVYLEAIGADITWPETKQKTTKSIRLGPLQEPFTWIFISFMKMSMIQTLKS